MARGKRGVKFPGRASGEGRRPSISSISASDDQHSAAEQMDKIQEVCLSLAPSRPHMKHTQPISPTRPSPSTAPPTQDTTPDPR
ncbi:hypothetical protein IMZ48_18870 [Candidatus Bathyarchaeota archaeon]|nr:hypothetical protein [Candidatus Bathyarchaeota archaeon]